MATGHRQFHNSRTIQSSEAKRCWEERHGAYRTWIAPGRGALILFNLRHSPASLLPAASRCVEEYPVRSMAWGFDEAVQSALGETVLVRASRPKCQFTCYVLVAAGLVFFASLSSTCLGHLPQDGIASSGWRPSTSRRNDGRRIRLICGKENYDT